MANIPSYSGSTVNRGLPSIVWNSIPVLELQNRPYKGFMWFDDFHRTPLTTTTDPFYTVTAITSGTLVTGAEEYGSIVLTPAGTENQGIQLQLGESFYIDDDTNIAFGARIKLLDADQMDVFAGLAITDTTLNASNPSDGVGFVVADGSANINYLVTKDSAGSNTDTGVDAVDATYVNVECLIEGESSVKFYVNNVLTNTVTSGLPNDEQLALSFGTITGEGTANTVHLDYVYGASWLR